MATPIETLSATQHGANPQAEPQCELATWEPGGKVGVVLLTGTFFLITLLILGDMVGSLFR